MTQRITPAPRKLVIWVVAAATVWGTLLQAFDALIHSSLPSFLLWVAGACVSGGFAVFIEKYKGIEQ